MFILEEKKREVLDLLKQRLSKISEEYLKTHSYGISIFPEDLIDRGLSKVAFRDIINILIKEGKITFAEPNEPHGNIRFIYTIFISENFFALCEQEKKLEKKGTSEKNIPIKNILLNERYYLLEINDGEKIIQFKSKKKKQGLEKETKLFKILFHLWNFRWEFKNNKVIRRGNYALLENIAIGSGIKTTGATYKQIQRLNKRFKEEGVTIEIKGENEKYRLIVNMA